MERKLGDQDLAGGGLKSGTVWQMTVTFFATSDQNATEYRQLAQLSGRIAALLESPKVRSRSPLLACLDDLLGAVYSLFYAKHHNYADRIKPLGPDDIKAVSVRAKDMAHYRVRTEGKWTAGFYFNNALFRIAAVYHRALKTVVGDNAKTFKVLVREAHERFKRAQNSDWASGALEKVNCEVNGLKHTTEGILPGRDVTFGDAVRAAGELLTLIEALI